MTRESIVFFLGLIVFIVPYIGIPDAWKLYSYTVSGLLLMFVGYSLRHKAYIRSIEKENGERDTDSFVENNGSRPKEEDEFNI
ncbi:MAG: hypothetical protein ACI92I_000679 [Acidimicrobiales bacterium]|jgi:hypothetical protein